MELCLPDYRDIYLLGEHDALDRVRISFHCVLVIGFAVCILVIVCVISALSAWVLIEVIFQAFKVRE